MAKHGFVKRYHGAEGKVVELFVTNEVKDTVTEILGGVRHLCVHI